MESPAAFSRTLERFGSRLMIRSACAQCGKSRLVSQHDGSLQEWEDGHHCSVSDQEKKAPASAQVGSQLRLRKIAGGKPGSGFRDDS